MKPEVLKSWSLEIDYSRAPCLGADQKAGGLWERDCLKSQKVIDLKQQNPRDTAPLMRVLVFILSYEIEIAFSIK